MYDRYEAARKRSINVTPITERVIRKHTPKTKVEEKVDNTPEIPETPTVEVTDTVVETTVESTTDTDVPEVPSDEVEVPRRRRRRRREEIESTEVSNSEEDA